MTYYYLKGNLLLCSSVNNVSSRHSRESGNPEYTIKMDYSWYLLDSGSSPE